jgi:nitrite reductase/ring-hydroxylating ferredoxin subunit
MSNYKDIIVKYTSDGRYFGIEDNCVYWLCAGGMITCDCPCNIAGDELRAAKNVETITWAGKFYLFNCTV